MGECVCVHVCVCMWVYVYACHIVRLLVCLRVPVCLQACLCDCVYVRIIVNYCNGVSVFSTMRFNSEFALRDLPEQRLTDNVLLSQKWQMSTGYAEFRPCAVAQSLRPWPSVFGNYH